MFQRDAKGEGAPLPSHHYSLLGYSTWVGGWGRFVHEGRDDSSLLPRNSVRRWLELREEMAVCVC